MFTTAISLTGYFLVFLGYGAFAFGLAVLIGKCIAYGDHSPSFEDQGRERIGLSPVAELAAEREARANRARFRHLTRYGRSA